jgi:hypothetical protein
VLILQADIRSNVQFNETDNHYGIDPSSLNLPFNICLIQDQNFFSKKLLTNTHCAGIVMMLSFEKF